MATDAETIEPRRRSAWAWLFAGCLLLVLLAFVVPLALPPYSYAPQSANYLGITNGVVGSLLPTFLKVSTPTDAARLEAWLAAGTNSAIYAFTNREICSVWVFPFVGVAHADGKQGKRHVPLLNAPDLNGILVQPGEVAQLLIPIPADGGPWRVEFGYTLFSCSPTYPGYLKYKDLPDGLVNMLTGRGINRSTIPIPTDQSISPSAIVAKTNALY